MFRLTPSEFLSENELAAANLVRFEEFNSQNQPKVTWPPSFIVAKAYLDQLERGKAIDGGARHGAARRRSTRATRAPANAARSTSSTRWRPSSRRDAARRAPRTRRATRRWPTAIKARTARLR